MVDSCCCCCETFRFWRRPQQALLTITLNASGYRAFLFSIIILCVSGGSSISRFAWEVNQFCALCCFPSRVRLEKKNQSAVCVCVVSACWETISVSFGNNLSKKRLLSVLSVCVWDRKRAKNARLSSTNKTLDSHTKTFLATFFSSLLLSFAASIDESWRATRERKKLFHRTSTGANEREQEAIESLIIGRLTWAGEEKTQTEREDTSCLSFECARIEINHLRSSSKESSFVRGGRSRVEGESTRFTAAAAVDVRSFAEPKVRCCCCFEWAFCVRAHFWSPSIKVTPTPLCQLIAANCSQQVQLLLILSQCYHSNCCCCLMMIHLLLLIALEAIFFLHSFFLNFLLVFFFFSSLYFVCCFFFSFVFYTKRVFAKKTSQLSQLPPVFCAKKESN